MTYLGKQIATGTGMEVRPDMYTIARLEEHLGRSIWFVKRQTTCKVSALKCYLEQREIWGNDAQIHLIVPGSFED